MVANTDNAAAHSHHAVPKADVPEEDDLRNVAAKGVCMDSSISVTISE